MKLLLIWLAGSGRKLSCKIEIHSNFNFSTLIAVIQDLKFSVGTRRYSAPKFKLEDRKSIYTEGGFQITPEVVGLSQPCWPTGRNIFSLKIENTPKSLLSLPDFPLFVLQNCEDATINGKFHFPLPLFPFHF